MHRIQFSPCCNSCHTMLQMSTAKDTRHDACYYCLLLQKDEPLQCLIGIISDLHTRDKIAQVIQQYRSKQCPRYWCPPTIFRERHLCLLKQSKQNCTTSVECGTCPWPIKEMLSPQNWGNALTNARPQKGEEVNKICSPAEASVWYSLLNLWGQAMPDCQNDSLGLQLCLATNLQLLLYVNL